MKSMAEAAVSSVLHKLDDAALNKTLELYHVSDQVEAILVKLRMIQSFLKEADFKRKKNPMIKQWVGEVIDAVHRIEDAIDTFLVEIEENMPKGSGFITNFKRLGGPPPKLGWFSNELKEIQMTVEGIVAISTQLGITCIGAGIEENSEGPSKPTEPDNIDVSRVGFEVVGFDAQKYAIIRNLLDKSISKLTVLSIVGIGGLGKTTLAKMVFQSAELKEQFDCRTWLFISQKFTLTNLLKEILYSIDPQMKNKNPAMKDMDLPMELNTSLWEKRYLIILDDVWTTDLWDQLKIILPDTNNGSRVLITSRSSEVATATDPIILPHILSYLTEKASLALLLRKALPYKQPSSYPPNIKKVAKRLTKKCGGLPLSLSVLGGVLSRRDPSIWRNIEQTMDWHNDVWNKCSQVLALSYNDLPYHLKSCFLYFASFPKDSKISTKHIIRMWTAEGFIPKDGVETLESKARNFLQELVDRNWIEVVEISWQGFCSYCTVNGVLLDLAIHEAKEDKFVTVFSKTEYGSQLDATVGRRAALQFCIPTKYGVHSTNTRSLLFFGQYESNYRGFRLLRVLAIENVDMREKKLNENWLQGLIHLRYLGFRYCGRLPSEFGRISFRSLTNLETVDFKGTQIPEGPDDSLWEVKTLRHVIASNSKISFIRDPSKWENLRNLETLKWVNLQMIPEPRSNINLHKIGIFLDENLDFWKQGIEKAQEKLKGVLQRMKNLVSLSVISNIYVPLMDNGTRGLSCHEKIQCLHFIGKWPKGIDLNVQMLPPNLAKFTLFGSKLQKDPMPVLKELKNLKVLQLRKDSYWGKELICSMGGFPSLEKLELSNLPRLNQWEIEKAAMPVLSQLQIWGCSELQVVPELRKVLTQEVLIEGDLLEELRRKMQSQNQNKNRLIPTWLFE